MRHLLPAIIALAIAGSPQPLAAQSSPSAPAATTVATLPAGIPIREDGLVATWYPPADGKRGPIVLALGGSEGGESGGKRVGSAVAAATGFGVLSLAYFGADGLPPILQEIPLEYFDRALAWIARQPLADPKRIGIYGISVGGETALVVASRHPEIKAVIAAVPSSVVWQGINPTNYLEVRSTYSLAGKPVAFVPYDGSAPFTGILDLYERSLKMVPEHQDAIIPVERIGGDLLLLSAKDDKLWPSTAMADAVIARLDAKGFTHRREHIAYDSAGHGAMSPPSGDAIVRALNNLGGTTAGNQAARMAMWGQVKAFLTRTLSKVK